MARPTARMTSATSPAKLRPPPSGATGAPPGHPRRRRHQQEERGRQHELPGDREDLIHPDAHEAPAHPGDEEEHRHRLEEEPHGPEPVWPRSRPGAEEEERPQERRAD